jgi:hypothetical protein
MNEKIPNPFLWSEGLNPLRAFRIGRTVTFASDEYEQAIARAVAALLGHPRHTYDLSSLDDVAGALGEVRDELARGEDLPKPSLAGLRSYLQGLAVAPELPEAPLPPPRPSALPDPATFTDDLLQA